MDKNRKVSIYTDGACRGNPGPGGYAAILKFSNAEKIISGGDPDTTNNRMEMMAVIEAVKALKGPHFITLYTDSRYVANAIEKGWAKSWRKNGWIKADKKPALNSDLWEELLNLLEPHDLKIIWVKGHNGHPENERCDEIAVSESMKF